MRTLQIVLCCLLTGASIGAIAQPAHAPPEAKKLIDAMTGRAALKPADNPNCRMFTFAEIEKYLGQPVAAIDHAGGATGCQWIAKDEESNVIVSVFGSRHFVAPKLGKGFKTLPKFGSHGYVVPDSGGWDAGTVVGELGIVVSVAGKNKEAEAIALLEETVKRHRLVDRPSPRAQP